MKIITQDTEKYLLETIERRLGLPAPTFCLHITGSGFTNTEFEALPRLIETWIGEESGEVLICHDRDVFIFSPNLSEKTFLQFKERFRTLFERDAGPVRVQLSFYNLDIQSFGLIELAKAKLARERARRSDAARQDTNKLKALRSAQFHAIILNQDMEGTIVKRRQMRSKLEILVVEDDPFSRKLIATALSNFSVSFAEDGTSAIMGYLQKAPDIVFLDIDLPDVTGNEVLAKILSFDPAAYIVMLSGNSQTENVIKTTRAGARGFVGKPFTMDKLLHYIGKCPRNYLEYAGL
jgi:CheY-like chemotaxis protein